MLTWTERFFCNCWVVYTGWKALGEMVHTPVKGQVLAAPDVLLECYICCRINANCQPCLEIYFILNSYPVKVAFDYPECCCLWCERMSLSLVLMYVTDNSKLEHKTSELISVFHMTIRLLFWIEELVITAGWTAKREQLFTVRSEISGCPIRCALQKVFKPTLVFWNDKVCDDWSNAPVVQRG